MPDAQPSRPRVAVVYHFFAHYRGPVMHELLGSDRYEFLAVGDRHDPAGKGIREWSTCPPARFVYAPCLYLRHPFMIQRGLLRLALRRDLVAIIYLGVALWPSTWLSAIVARLTGKRVLFWTHGWTRPDHGPKRLLRRVFYRLGHGLLTYGHYAKMIAIRERFDPASVHVIYNSLDVAAQKAVRERVTERELHELREELFPGSRHPMVICTGRLIGVRRLDLLLDALAVLRDDDHPVDLVLIGDGPEQPALERSAADRGLAVHFEGACYEETRIARFVMAACVTVAPGKVGLTAMHSLVYGTPVITHDDEEDQMPEWEAIIPGRTGDLFRRDDARDLARVIRRWTSTRVPDAAVRHDCHAVIDRFYNPAFQRRAIERALDGEPANDLFWMREDAAWERGP